MAVIASTEVKPDKDYAHGIFELLRPSQSAIVLGGDLTHEYVSENADYRS